MPSSRISKAVIQAARELTENLDSMTFPPPIAHVYNPLTYAWRAHEQYLRRFAATRKAVVFLGMNPGPFGMMQTAVPFGEISYVRDWIGIKDGVDRPRHEHPKRPILGFECKRSEVSGQRLWGLFKEKFETAEAFFKDHFVANYCPLAFLEESGRNFTPDKLPAPVARTLEGHCDAHLRQIVGILKPQWLIGIGAFARKQAERAVVDSNVQFGQILHPSPASPAANRGWAAQAYSQLTALGVLD